MPNSLVKIFSSVVWISIVSAIEYVYKEGRHLGSQIKTAVFYNSGTFGFLLRSSLSFVLHACSDLMDQARLQAGSVFKQDLSWGVRTSYLVRGWREEEFPVLIFIPRTKNLLVSVAPAATAAKSLQSCLTMCDPIDGSSPGSPVPGILQARTLEWVAISFSILSLLLDVTMRKKGEI